MTTKLEKTFEDAKKALEKEVEKEAWSEANLKKGYLDGVLDFSERVSFNGEMRLKQIELFVAGAVSVKDYGRAAYHRSYLAGWMTAETAYRLDILEAKEK